MDITFKFIRDSVGWTLLWSENGRPRTSWHTSRTKAVNKMHRLIVRGLLSKDSFEVTYHIPESTSK